jgi:hypothetical protein
MASRIFGTAAARILRTTVAPTKVVSAAGSASGTGGFAAWKVLAAASSSLAVGSALSDAFEAENVGPGKSTAGNQGNPANAFALSTNIPWRTILPTAATLNTECEAASNDPNLDADSEAKVEASLKSRMTSRRDWKERREQRNKFLKNQQANLEQKLMMRRRMTNVGRFSLVSETAQNPSVPVLVMAMTGKPYFAEDFRRLYQERKVAEKHPRFGARLDDTKTHFVFDNGGDPAASNNNNDSRGVSGVENVRDVAYPRIPVTELKDRVNDASLYEPLDLNSRLWEAWTATGGVVGQSGAIPAATNAIDEQGKGDEENVESLLLFRAHHCLGDGVSLGALFSDLTDEGPEIEAMIRDQIKIYKKKKMGTPWWKKLFFVLYYWIFGTMRALLYQIYLYAISWYDQYEHDDPWMILKAIYDEKRNSNIDRKRQQAIPPRSLSWQTIAPVEEVKRVAKFHSEVNRKQTGQKSKVTINDVFCSCASAAIVKQLAYHRAVNPKLSSSGRRLSLPSMNLIIPVHLQGGILLPGQGMGNKIGAMVSRIPGEHLTAQNIDSDDRSAMAQERLIQVHSVLNSRKQTPVAALSYLMASFMGYLSPSSSSSSETNSTGYTVGSSPSSWTPWIFRKAHANASVVVTNVRGPEQPLHIQGRPVRAFWGFLPLPAGVPVGLVVNSYDNKISMTVTAEEYAVPDAEQFLGWVKDEYELLKQRADEAKGTNQ